MSLMDFGDYMILDTLSGPALTCCKTQAALVSTPGLSVAFKRLNMKLRSLISILNPFLLVPIIFIYFLLLLLLLYDAGIPQVHPVILDDLKLKAILLPPAS